MILSELPTFLRDEVVGGAYGKLAVDVPFMRRMPASMVSMLVMELKFETVRTPVYFRIRYSIDTHFLTFFPISLLQNKQVFPTQCIVRKQTLGREMYIVMGGLVQLFYGDYTHDNFALTEKNIAAMEDAMRERPGVSESPFVRNPEADKGFKISRGDIFSEYALLFAVPPRHIYTAVAIERTMVLSFHRDAYLKILEVYPQLRDQILEDTNLADPMITSLAMHFGNEDAMKMSVAVGKMKVIVEHDALNTQSMPVEHIHEVRTSLAPGEQSCCFLLKS